MKSDVIEFSDQQNIPSWFFTQSAVVPFQIEEGKIKILLITSRKKKRWIIPKGVVEPELSPSGSAAQEAFEEAGVKGSVAAQEIGVYSYPKWDASCTVKVYPMQVEQVIDKDNWEESHRGRRWMSVAEAVEKLENPDVKRIVGLLPGWLGEQQA